MLTTERKKKKEKRKIHPFKRESRSSCCGARDEAFCSTGTQVQFPLEQWVRNPAADVLGQTKQNKTKQKKKKKRERERL